MKNHLRNTPFILAGIWTLLTLCALQVHALPTPTPGGLLEYTSQGDFESAFPGLPKEDFEESPVPDGIANGPCTGPLDSSTNQPLCFVPGDILPGISFDADPGHILGAVGKGWTTLTNSSVVIVTTPPTDIMSITFSGNDVYAVGMDISALNAVPFVVKVYGAGNTLLDTLTSPAVTTTGIFFGVYSPQPITKITLDSGAADYVFVDNVQFGGTASTVTFFTDQSTFEADWPGLPVEDFEESPVPDGGGVVLPEPLDKTTNVPGAFSPGDILDDINISSVTHNNPATALVVLGDNFGGVMGNPSKVVCDSGSENGLQIVFLNQAATELEANTYAIGLDLWQAAPAAAPPVTGIISVYDLLGRLLGATTISVAAGQGNFFGVSSNQVLIFITFQIVGGSPTECIDNIQYGGPPAGLTFYRTRDDFKKARSNLPMEDFSESPVPDNTPVLCSEPIDSTTSEAGCFAPGDILPNISFQTESSLHPACPTCLVLYGANTGSLGNISPMLAVNAPDLLEMSFTGKRVHFAGVNTYILSIFTIYGPNDTLLGTSIRYGITPTLGFWGVESAQPISRITIWGIPALVNEVSFGGKFPWPMYGPATGGAGTSAP